MGNHPRRSKVADWPGFLKEFRASHRLTQTELADCLQISRRLVENWEAGVNLPPPYLKAALMNMDRQLNALRK
jgi:DNA-binding transcriptional regulator YiaG